MNMGDEDLPASFLKLSVQDPKDDPETQDLLQNLEMETRKRGVEADPQRRGGDRRRANPPDCAWLLTQPLLVNQPASNPQTRGILEA